MLPGFASKKKRAKQLQTEAAMRTFRQVEQQTQPRRLVPFSTRTAAGTPFDLSFQREDPDYAREGIERLKKLREHATLSVQGKVPPDLETPEQRTQHFILNYAGIRARQGLDFDSAIDEAVQNAVAHGIPEKYARDEAERNRGFWSKLGGALLKEGDFIADVAIRDTVHDIESAFNRTRRFKGVLPLLKGEEPFMTEREAEEHFGPSLDISRELQARLDAADEAKVLSRPVVLGAQEALARTLEGRGGRENVLSRAVRSRAVTEVGAELLNPIYLVSALPFLSLRPGVSGARATADVISQLVATGLEPGAAVGFYKGFRAIGKGTLRATLRGLAKGTVQTLEKERGTRLAAGILGEADPKAQGLAFSRWVMNEDDPYEAGVKWARATNSGVETAVTNVEDLAARQRTLTDLIQEKEINPLTGRPTQEPPTIKSPMRVQIEDEIKAGKTAEELLDETTARIAESPRLAGEEVGDVSDSLSKAGIPEDVARLLTDPENLYPKGTQVSITKGPLSGQTGKITSYTKVTNSYKIRVGKKTTDLQAKFFDAIEDIEQQAGKITSEVDDIGVHTNISSILDESDNAARAQRSADLGADEVTGEPVRPSSDPAIPHPDKIPDKVMTKEAREAMYRVIDKIRRTQSWTAVVQSAMEHEMRALDVDLETGLIRTATPKDGVSSTHWAEVLSDPDKYDFVGAEASDIEKAIRSYNLFTFQSVEDGVRAGIFDDAFLNFIKPDGKRYVHRVAISIEQDGEVIELRRSSRHGPLGQKQSHQMPRTRETIDEAGRPEVVYLNNPSAALAEFIEEVNYRIAVKELANDLEKYAVTPHAQQATRVAYDEAREKAQSLSTQLEDLTRTRLVMLDEERLAEAAGEVKNAERLRSNLTAIELDLDQTNKELKTARSQAKRLQKTVAYEKKTFRSINIELQGIREPFAGGKLYPKSVADTVERTLRLNHRGIVYGTAVKGLELLREVNKVFKPVWASADMSFIGLQTLPSLAVNPVAFADMMKVTFSSAVDGDVYNAWVHSHLPLLQDMIDDGVPMLGTELSATDLLNRIEKTAGKWSTKYTPLWFMKGGNHMWNRAVNMIGASLYEQNRALMEEVGHSNYLHLAQKAFGPNIVGKDITSARRALADVVSHGTGRLSANDLMHRGPGMRLLSDSILFAGQYFESYLRLIMDARRLGIRGNLGRRLLAGWATTAIGGYVALSYILGQEPKLDPTKYGSQILTVRLGNQNVGFGGVLQQLMLYGGRLSEAKSPQDVFDITERFVRSKQSPALSFASDLFINRADYIGRKLDTRNSILAYLASRFVPFVGQDMLRETLARGLSGDWRLPEELNPTNVIGTLLGGRSFPVSKKTLRNEIGVEEYRLNNPQSKETDEYIVDNYINPQVFMSDPENYPRTMKAQEEVDAWQRETGSKWQEYSDKRQSYNDNQFQKDIEDGAKEIQWGRAGGGVTFREDVLPEAYAGKNSYNDQTLLDLGLNPDDLPEVQGNDIKLLRDYHALNYDSYKAADGITPDPEGYKAAQQSILNQMSPAMRGFIESGKDGRITSRKGKDANTRLISTRTDLRRWFDAPKYKGLTGDESKQVDQLLEWASTLHDMATLSGVSIDRRKIIAMMGSIPQYSKLAAVAFFATFEGLKSMVLSDEQEKITMSNGDLAVFYPFTYEDLSDELKVDWAKLYGMR